MKSEKISLAQDTAHAEQLNNALDDLRAGRSPEYFSAEPAFQTALRLHISSSPTSAEIDDAYEEQLQHRLLRQFTEEEPSRGLRWWMPRIAPVIGLALVLVIALNVNTAVDDQPNQLAIQTNNTNTSTSNNNAEGETVQGLQPNMANNNVETTSDNTNIDDGVTTNNDDGGNENVNINTTNDNAHVLDADIASADLTADDITAASTTLTTTLTGAETDVDDSVAYSDISTIGTTDIDLMMTSLSSL
ncbi:MAG: hypothetical protein HYV32_01425 [Candidatus Kerfeldbacteria bacterium]|nr:hypothetical protein [Candidatus Kerfeldbacteria bacterium]